MNSKLKTERSPLFNARLAGFLYIIMAPFAVFGMMFVKSLIVPGDIAMTANNIMASASLLRLSIVSSLLTQVGHILLVLVLYKLLKPVSKNLASLMVIFLILAAPIAMLNELNLFAALHLSSGVDYLKAFGADQLHAQMMLFLDLREQGVNIVDLLWGLWLFPFGYLVYKSGFLPRILGVTLIIGGFGYLMQTFGNIVLPQYEVIGAVGAMAAMFELVIPFWLLIKGVNIKKWEERALESEELTVAETTGTVAGSPSARLQSDQNHLGGNS